MSLRDCCFFNDFSNRWCKWENVKPGALEESSFRHLKPGIQDFNMNYVLVLPDKAANNFVVV